MNYNVVSACHGNSVAVKYIQVVPYLQISYKDLEQYQGIDTLYVLETLGSFQQRDTTSPVEEVPS